MLPPTNLYQVLENIQYIGAKRWKICNQDQARENIQYIGAKRWKICNQDQARENIKSGRECMVVLILIG